VRFSLITPRGFLDQPEPFTKVTVHMAQI
jgi:hypothetical protein